MKAIRRRTMLIRKPTPEPYLSTPSPDRSPPPSTIFTDCPNASDEDMDPEEMEDDTLLAGERHSPKPRPRPAPLTSHSRPTSFAPSDVLPQGPYCPRVPTLDEILANTAPPPWTLSAFTAYLSQNHCMENLEFVTDVERYRQAYATARRRPAADDPLAADAADEGALAKLWARLVHSYVARDTPREINLPSDVRDQLLALSADPEVNPDAEPIDVDGAPPSALALSPPPPPAVLDPAVKVVHELLNESVLMAFVHELSPGKPPSISQDLDDTAAAASAVSPGDESSLSRSAPPRPSFDRSGAAARRPLPHAASTRRSRSPSAGHHRDFRRRTPPPTSGRSDELDFGPPAGSTGAKHSVSSLARSLTNSGRSISTRRGGGAGSMGGGNGNGGGGIGNELALLSSDDGASTGSAAPSPMTPPTTPPASEHGGGLGTSPKSLGRDTAWRKMMGRFGSKRKGSGGGRSDQMEF